jgi:hypothetical protein
LNDLNSGGGKCEHIYNTRTGLCMTRVVGQLPRDVFSGIRCDTFLTSRVTNEKGINQISKSPIQKHFQNSNWTASHVMRNKYWPIFGIRINRLFPASSGGGERHADPSYTTYCRPIHIVPMEVSHRTEYVVTYF